MQRLFARIFVLTLVLGALFVMQGTVSAQTINAVQPFSADISPQYPAPYGTVTITPSSTLFDIGGSSVVVTVNGTRVYRGSGGQPIEATIGGPGVATNIVVTATNAGQTYSQSFVVRPEQVALITEPVSTTHPFYEGKGLISPEGRVRFVALADIRNSSGAQLDPSTLEYTWKMNDQVLESSSGIGKSVLSAQAPQRYRDVTVSVTVQNTDGTLVAQATTPVSAADPYTLIYRDDPLLGPLFEQALSSSISLSGDEDTYLGVPYYFSETPAVEWDINGASGSTDPALTVRGTGNGQGTAQLSFTATQSDTNQTANSTLQVLFGNTNSVGIFGL